jgi:exportin-2 (importin alpha re-exporter)
VVFQIALSAEKFLHNSSHQPGFPSLILHVVELTDLDVQVRQVAAIFFKNFVKNNWSNVSLCLTTTQGSQKENIHPNDRQQIKRIIIDLSLNVPAQIQKQLSAALESISDSDFPAQWPELLPVSRGGGEISNACQELVKKFETKDLTVISGVLHTSHSILKRFLDLISM